MGACAAQVSFTNGTWSARQIWSNGLASHWMTPVCHHGYLYGHFGASGFAPFKCISMETGAERWSIDGFGRSGTLLVNDHIVALTEDGMLVLVQPTPEAYVELGRFQAVTGKCWNSPAVCDGRVYVRSTSLAACYDLSTSKLKLERPRLLDGGGLELTITTANGSPLSTNRLPGIGVLATSSLEVPVAQWTKLTNALVLTNGSVHVAPLDTTSAGWQFFSAMEAAPRFLAVATVGGGKLQLRLRGVDGAAVDPSRLPNIELRANANPASPLTDWVRLTDPLQWNDGTLWFEEPIEPPPSQRFFRAEEQP
jgi:hypothetical protein